MHDAFGKARFVLPGKGPFQLELTLADDRLDAFAVGHRENSFVQKGLLARLVLPSGFIHLQQKLLVSDEQTFKSPRNAASM